MATCGQNMQMRVWQKLVHLPRAFRWRALVAIPTEDKGGAGNVGQDIQLTATVHHGSFLSHENRLPQIFCHAHDQGGQLFALYAGGVNQGGK